MDPEIDPYETPEYQMFVEECAKHCHCKNGPCDGCLAGGICDHIDHLEDREDDSYKFFFDDENYD